jgi:hypothetical protein
MKLPLLCFIVAIATAPLRAATLVDDHFTSPKLAGRELAPGRGTWQIADGAATCTQDDALYEKNKSHGPIIWYDAPFTDGTIRFSVRAQKVKQFVVTLNNDQGHLFRVVAGQFPLAVHVWKEQSHEARADNLPAKDAPKLPEDAWVQVELTFAGDQCTITLGDTFKQTFTHPTIAKKKTKFGLGFAYGTVSLRNVSIATP